jgi:membrane-associated PAP2 superfamily phosphatase
MASIVTRSRRRPGSAPSWPASAEAADRGFALQLAYLGIAAAAIWLVFEQAGLDRWLTALAYDSASHRFPLQHSQALEIALHDGIKWAMVAFWIVCLAWRPLRRGALYMAIAAVAVLLLRALSAHSCPWDLPQYGAASLAGPGRCSPAAHPLAGFALFGLYFALRPERRAAAARAALVAAWILGLGAGAIQVARGAHFASHVLWTAWVAWAVTLAASRLVTRLA